MWRMAKEKKKAGKGMTIKRQFLNTHFSLTREHNYIIKKWIQIANCCESTYTRLIILDYVVFGDEPRGEADGA